MTNHIEEMCRAHFNEPVLTYSKVGRLIGYAEDDMDCYLIIKYPWEEKPTYHTAVGGYIWLTPLRDQNIVHPKHPTFEGEIWDDYTRIDGYLTTNGVPREVEFKNERI